MNRDLLFGTMQRLRGTMLARWGMLIHVDAVVAIGRHNQLLGRIQQLRGAVREASRTQLRDWAHSHRDLRFGLARHRS